MAVEPINLNKNILGWFKGTKASIEALTGIPVPSIGFGWTVDESDGEFGVYNGVAWTWGTGTGGITFEEVFERLVNAEAEDINGSFNTDTVGWVLGTGWTHNAGIGKVEHTPGNTATLTFPGELIEGAKYNISVTLTVTAGTVTIGLGDFAGTVFSTSQTGYVFQKEYSSDGVNKVVVTPSSDFAGNIDSITLSRVDIPQDSPLDGLTYGRSLGSWVAAMRRSVYDADADGVVDNSKKWNGFDIEAGTPASLDVPSWDAGDGTFKYSQRMRFTGAAPAEGELVEFSDTSGNNVRASGVLTTDLITEAFPVGSVFISVVSTNPATLLGYGTWASFGAGRVMVGLDAGQTEFDTVEETGGAKTHTLTQAQIPNAQFALRTVSGFSINVDAGATGSVLRIAYDAIGAAANGTAGQLIVDNGGGSESHNNLQPYIVCYFWKRTA